MSLRSTRHRPSGRSILGRLRIALARLRGLRRSDARDTDLRAELNSHLDEAIAELRRGGLTEEDARRAAHRQLGGVAQVEANWREQYGGLAVDRLAADLRQSVRALRRSAGFALASFAVLAIGIGGITSVFTLLNAI